MKDQHTSRCENCIIRQLNSLKALNKEELKKISDSKVTKSVKKGEAIFEEGEKLNGVFCVRDGVSKLSSLPRLFLYIWQTTLSLPTMLL